jgi:PAS domain S-box-containing protein
VRRRRATRNEAIDTANRDRTRALVGELSEEFLGAVIVLNRSGTIMSWNKGAETLFGFAQDEVLDRSVFETIVPPEYADEKRKRLESATIGGGTIYEAIRMRKDGLRIWVDVSMRTAQVGDGSILVVLNERDITLVKYRREAQILQSRFPEVLDAAPDAIVLVDSSGRIALVNAEAERLFEYGRGELLGELVELLVPVRYHREHPGHRLEYFKDPQRRPMGIGLHLAGRRKDGTEFPAEISLSPLSVDQSTFAMSAIRDVTSRRRIEEALKAANDELEAFTYSVSHDLRAPIRQIDGFSRLLSEHLGTTVDEKTSHYLKRVQEGTRHMGRLVDDLLNLAQLGRQDVRPRRVSLAELVTDVVAVLAPDLAGRDIQWTVGALPTWECDPGLMKVVFTNLLSNAAKYSRDRTPAIVEVGQGVHDGRHTVFVRDNGVGFDMKYADKLFGVFQRLHRVEDFEGTGVGLATVQRIIHKHRGQIWAESEPDRGATFYFTIGGADTAPDQVI